MNASGIILVALGLLTVSKLRTGTAGTAGTGRLIDPVYDPNGRPRRLPAGLTNITERNPAYFTIYAGAYDDAVRRGAGSTEASESALNVLSDLGYALTVHPPASAKPGGEPVASPGGGDDPRVDRTAETVEAYARAGRETLGFLNEVVAFFRGLRGDEKSDGPAGVNGQPGPGLGGASYRPRSGGGLDPRGGFTA